MTAQQHWYNQDKVSQHHSVILTNFKREQEAKRAALKVKNATDSTLVKSGDAKILELFNIGSSKVTVNANTAQRLSSVGACITLRANAMSTLPLHHYKTDSDGNRSRVTESSYWKLLNQSPIGNWTSAAMYQWWERCTILRGDAYTEIIRDIRGNVIALMPWHPDRTIVEENDNELIYIYSPLDGSKPYAKSADDVLHMTGPGFNGKKSLSAIQYDAHNSIGMALAASEYSRRFFENGASPKHLFETESKMDVDQIDKFRELYDSRYAGPANAGRPMILTEGLKMHALSMTAVDAQLLETLKYSVIDNARAIGVPPVLIGAQETTSSWGTGVGEIKQGFVTFHLEPRANIWEQEVNRKLIRKEQEFVEFSFKAFLRGDAKTEADALRQAIGGSQGPGWLTIDEVRKINNEPPLPDGEGSKIYIPKGGNNEQKTTTAD